MIGARQARFSTAILAGLLLAALVAPAQRKPSPKRALPVQPAEAPVPFRAGEVLDYRVQWSKLLNAATVRLAVTERRPFYGREAWHFRALAHTVDPMRYLFALDDQFDS